MRKASVFSAFLALAGCKGDDVKTPPPGGARGPNGANGPTDGGATSGTASVLSQLGEQLQASPVLDAKYAVSVTVAGIPVCTGTANLLVNVPSTPVAGAAAKRPLDVKCIALNCAFGKQVSIASLLGGLSSPPSSSSNDASNVLIDDKYLRVKGGPQATFTPPLVLIPNFSGGSPAFLKTMNESQSLRLVDPSSKVDISGKQTMKTLAFESTWADPNMPGVTFNKIFQFQIDTDGFLGIDKLKYLLFTGLGARVNLAPLSLVSLDLTTKVSDLLAVFKGAGTEPAASSAECGTPPPAPQGDGILANLLAGKTGSGGSGTAGSGTAGTGSGVLIGAVAGLLSKLINVDFHAVLMDQKGLKEAIGRQNEVDQLINSQTSGTGT